MMRKREQADSQRKMKGDVYLKEQYEYMRMPAAMRHHLLNDDAEMITTVMAVNNTAPEMSPFPDKTPVAMAYVPYQKWGETYSHQDALCRGTIFKELDLPFAGGDCPYE